MAGFEALAGHALSRERPPEGLIPKTCPNVKCTPGNLLTFGAGRVMILVTFTDSLGPTKASTAGPILTSGPCFSCSNPECVLIGVQALAGRVVKTIIRIGEVNHGIPL